MATAAPHTFEAVTAVFECAGQSFTAKGKTILCEGWKEIDRKYRAALKSKPETDDADSDTEKTLPPFTEGQTFENPAAKVTEHDTTPPNPHNEASLLSAMAVSYTHLDGYKRQAYPRQAKACTVRPSM